MSRAYNYFSREKDTRYYFEAFWSELRLHHGLFSNFIGIKVPLFCGHKLTYNCNLRCKMCPFWKKTSKDSSFEKEKTILKRIYDSGVCAIAFEGGEPLLRNDLAKILAYSRSLRLQTSLVTNGTLLKSKIDQIASYINGVIYISLDGLEKTHDKIRGTNGCFRKAVEGIIASRGKAFVTINTTIMEDNLHEIEDMVKLTKELNAEISVAVAYEYCDVDVSAPTINEIKKMANRLIKMKKEGYPIVNSVNYFKVMAKERNWKCRPWMVINVDPEGKLVLPCYVRNEYTTTVSILDADIRTALLRYDWKEIKNCNECTFHCYVEPSLVLSWDFGTYLNWVHQVRL